MIFGFYHIFHFFCFIENCLRFYVKSISVNQKVTKMSKQFQLSPRFTDNLCRGQGSKNVFLVLLQNPFTYICPVCSLSGLNGKMYASLFLLKLGKLFCRIHNFLLNFFLFTFPFSGIRQGRARGYISVLPTECLYYLKHSVDEIFVNVGKSLFWSSF